jgi:hypothetical protein
MELRQVDEPTILDRRVRWLCVNKEIVTVVLPGQSPESGTVATEGAQLHYPFGITGICVVPMQKAAKITIS